PLVVEVPAPIATTHRRGQRHGLWIGDADQLSPVDLLKDSHMVAAHHAQSDDSRAYRHQPKQASRSEQIRSLAEPASWGSVSAGGSALRTAAAMARSSVPTSTFQTDSTVSSHSVSSSTVQHGTPNQQASFSTPPDPLTITPA